MFHEMSVRQQGASQQQTQIKCCPSPREMIRVSLAPANQRPVPGSRDHSRPISGPGVRLAPAPDREGVTRVLGQELVWTRGSVSPGNLGCSCPQLK